MTIEIVIFSFNRGHLLLNCVASVKRFMPGVPITIFDDQSGDRETLAALEEFKSSGIAVLTPTESRNSREYKPNGGLPQNIQAFVDVHASKPVALLLQDDTQLVRDFTEADMDNLQQIFRDFPKAAFVHPGFLYDYYREFLDASSLDEPGLTFSFQYDHDFSGYFDVCIAHVDRLRNAHWVFTDERRTSLTARERFGTMRVMRQPFVGILPCPPAYRDRRRTFTQRLWAYKRAGVYPIDPLTESELTRLFSLKTGFPTVEAFLKSRYKGSQPWPYDDLEGRPQFVETIDRFETRARRVLRRFLR
jgi:hypothetical protein